MRLGHKMSDFRAVRGILLLVVAIGACTLFGCDKREATPKDSDVAASGQLEADGTDGVNGHQAADAAENDRGEARVLLEVESWPGRRTLSTFNITWLGGEESVVLREFPSAQSQEITRRSWEDGSEVAWTDTRVVVYEGRSFRATGDANLDVVEFVPGVEVLEPEEMLGEGNVVLKLQAGDTIELYQFVGDETCYLGYNEKIYVGDCPGPEFQAEGERAEGQPRLEPLEQKWWVLVGEGAERGWVQIEGALFETRMRRMTEYE